MDLTEIEAQADVLLEKLRDSTSAADVRDLVFRLDGLYRGAQIKALLPDAIEQGRCGFRWKWNEGREQHYEVCTLDAGHGGTHHLNQVTGINKRKVDQLADKCGAKPVSPPELVLTTGSCILAEGHEGPHTDGGKAWGEGPTKPIADRLHELTSNWKSSADSYGSVARDGSTEEAFAVQLRACAGDLEAVLMEGGI